MYPDDLTRLRHMYDAASEALSFAESENRGRLDTDRKLVLALTKCVEIIGEAASKITNETKSRHSDIPWVVIVGMRHHLVHGYYDIDLDRVWNTIVHDLPPLVDALQKLLPTDPAE